MVFAGLVVGVTTVGIQTSTVRIDGAYWKQGEQSDFGESHGFPLALGYVPATFGVRSKLRPARALIHCFVLMSCCGAWKESV